MKQDITIGDLVACRLPRGWEPGHYYPFGTGILMSINTTAPLDRRYSVFIDGQVMAFGADEVNLASPA